MAEHSTDSMPLRRIGPVSDCESAWNKGSDAILVQSRSRGADETGVKQVQLGTPVHLTLNELEFGDLALGLSVGP